MSIILYKNKSDKKSYVIKFNFHKSLAHYKQIFLPWKKPSGLFLTLIVRDLVSCIFTLFLWKRITRNNLHKPVGAYFIYIHVREIYITMYVFILSYSTHTHFPLHNVWIFACGGKHVYHTRTCLYVVQDKVEIFGKVLQFQMFRL